MASKKASKKEKKNRQKQDQQAPWTEGFSNVPTGNKHVPLTGYLQKQLPDCTLIKMVYSDFRTLTASASQASYVYKVNSCFDPDFTGVGGQPDGFDQWKTLYQQYRVMACDVKVHACALAGAALCTVAGSVNSSVSSSAEEQIGLRRARGALANIGGQVAKMSARYRVSDIFGVPDSSVLDNDNYASSISGSPSSAIYARIECETSGATDAVAVWTTLTMYTRFEKPFDTQDSLARARRETLGAPPPQLTARADRTAQSATDDRLVELAVQANMANAQLQRALAEVRK